MAADKTHYGKPGGPTACGLESGEGNYGDTATRRMREVTCKACRKALRDGES